MKYILILLFLASCASSSDIKQHYLDKNVIGKYKIGKPYVINGKRYYPKKQPNYNKVGIASWYGSQFHNKKTANGAVFSKNLMTAAHKTLPLPSIVEVTNLKNGKKVKLIVNDRGPYVNNRIIDLSEKAAIILGTKKQGIAKVRVKFLKQETEDLLNGKNPLIKKTRINSNLSAEMKNKISKIKYYPVFIQVASFSSHQNAINSKDEFSKIIPNANLKIHNINDSYKLKFGPLDDKLSVKKLLMKLDNAGHSSVLFHN